MWLGSSRDLLGEKHRGELKELRAREREDDTTRSLAVGACVAARASGPM